MRRLLIILSFSFCCFVSGQVTPYQASSIITTLKTNDFVYAVSTDKIYALVSADDPENPNTIAIINPYTNSVENTVSLGSEPKVMAISDDGQYIYVGFRELSAIKRFSTFTQTIDLEFELGYDGIETDLYYTLHIDIAPNQNSLIAVARCDNFGNMGGVALFDSGMQLPLDTGYSDFTANRVQFIDQNTLFTYCTSCIPHKFRKYTVTGEGITLIQETSEDLPGGTWVSNLRYTYNNNKFYFNTGKVVDIIPSPHINGQMNITDEGDILYDTNENLVCSAYQATWPYVDPQTGYYVGDWRVRIDRFNPSTYSLVDSFYIQNQWDVDQIITCGDGCYALRTSAWNYGETLKRFIIVRDEALGTGNSLEHRRSVSLYPNPATDIITVKADNTLIKDYKIYNIEGKLLSEGSGGMFIDIKNLSQGLYLVKLIDENDNIYTEKIIKR